MGWATTHISNLQAGKTVSFRPRGHSMKGRVNDGQLCTVEPLGTKPPAIGEIVLCTVKGNQYLHLVKAENKGRFLIGNNRGGTNGWTSRSQIHGRLTKLEP